MNDNNNIDKDNMNNINNNNIDKYIESQIEKKLNKLLETLPDNIVNQNIDKQFYNMSIKDIYKNTLQNAIDIINDISELYSNKFYSKDYDRNSYIKELIDILMKNDRKIYVGIILILFSFIIYFIDGASV